MKNYKKNLALLSKNHVYSLDMEHDACGVGLISSTEGKKSRAVVEYGIEALKAVWPDMRHAVFGHLGDGNIHIIASIGTSDPDQRYRFDDILYRCLQHRGGSISAEHGIGTEKKAFLHYSRTPAEIDLMKALKNTLDSKNILNAGKVI